MSMFWTTEEDCWLRDMIEAGDTFSHIAAMMNTSRSAVAGRVRRLGLKGPRSGPDEVRPFGRGRHPNSLACLADVRPRANEIRRAKASEGLAYARAWRAINGPIFDAMYGTAA